MALLTTAVQWAARWGLSSAGRALHWQCRGQGFDSPRLHQPSLKLRLAGRSALPATSRSLSFVVLNVFQHKTLRSRVIPKRVRDDEIVLIV